MWKTKKERLGWLWSTREEKQSNQQTYWEIVQVEKDLEDARWTACQENDWIKIL